MPEDPFTKTEGYPGLWSTLNLPRFCKVSDKFLEISIVLDQSVEDKAIDVTGGRILREDGIKKRGIANRADDQLVDLLWRSEAYKENIDPQNDEEKNRRSKENGLDLQKGFPFIKGIWKPL